MDWEKLQYIDIRILYVIILLCMIIPMLSLSACLWQSLKTPVKYTRL